MYLSKANFHQQYKHFKQTNIIKFAHSAVFSEEVKPAPSASAEKVKELAMTLGYITILHKGATDVASNGRYYYTFLFKKNFDPLFSICNNTEMFLDLLFVALGVEVIEDVEDKGTYLRAPYPFYFIGL